MVLSDENLSCTPFHLGALQQQDVGVSQTIFQRAHLAMISCSPVGMLPIAAFQLLLR